ncbi:aldehyde dehydrogenase family protein [Lacticaseibacillus sp. GG6-2]
MEIDIEQLVNQIVSGKKPTPAAPESEPTMAPVVADAELSGVFDTVDAAIAAAKVAQRAYFHSTLAKREAIVQALRDQLAPEIDEIAKRGFDDTGMGNLDDKILKNRLALTKTPGTEDLALSSQVITGDNGMTLYEYCPYGVIGSITPSTNPTETIINNCISMLAAGNAVYFSPHPGAMASSQWLIARINRIVSDVSAIPNLVVTIAKPSIQAAQEMMVHPDISLLAVTGGPGVVTQAMKSGKKVIGAGAGNPPVLVDETANIAKASQNIVDGASFDNNLPCIAEKNVVVVKSVADALLAAMQNAGAIYLDDAEEIAKLTALVVTPKQTPNKQYVGQSAEKILQAAKIGYSGHPRLVLVDANAQSPFAKIEMLMPVLPFIRVPDFDQALATCLELEHGLHHTALIHSQDVTRLDQVAREMQTSIFVKNGPSYAGIGFNGEGPTTFTIATPTGEGTTTARSFARIRRCVLTDGFSIR